MSRPTGTHRQNEVQEGKEEATLLSGRRHGEREGGGREKEAELAPGA